jgi:Ni,Fe-hydrogenase III component G
MTSDDHLDVTLSTSDSLAMVALAATKLAIEVVLRVEDDDFTLKPVSPEMFVASFRSRELRDRASTVSVSQEWPPVSTR